MSLLLMFSALWKLLWTVSNHSPQQTLAILWKTTETINNANIFIPCSGQGQKRWRGTILRVDVQIGWRNSRAKPCTHASTVALHPPANSHRWPLGIVAADSFLITWRILPSKGKNTFLPCGFMPTCLSSNLPFPDSLHHVGCVWLIGRLVTRCNNNDIALTSLKPLNHRRTTGVEIWCLTSSHLDWPPGMKKSNLAHIACTPILQRPRVSQVLSG